MTDFMLVSIEFLRSAFAHIGYDTDIFGIILNAVGGCMILLALRRSINDQYNIRLDTYTPTATIETFQTSIFAFAILIAVYLLLNI